ncbi:MAG: hypothetical protein ACREMW_14040 [Gemmatimonadales bacterium]
MLSRYVWVGAFTIAVGCDSGTGPDAVPGPADFRGTISRVWEDGGYLVDDGSATACGFALMYVSDATEIRWRNGAPTSPAELQVGRRISVWQSGSVDPRCSTLQARAVVIETTLLR